MNLIKHILSGILIGAFFLIGAGCKEDTPSGPSSEQLNGYSIAVKDASCTEMFLSLKFPAQQVAQVVKLKRDTSIVFNGTIYQDTIIVDENLLPSHHYVYSATIAGKSGSLSVPTATSDTTSHNFSASYFEFGDQNHGSGGFCDIAILNDTLAYAVGMIYAAETGRRDSLGNWIDSRNASRWNGKKWEDLAVYGYFGGYNTYNLIASVFARNEGEVWFGVGKIICWNSSGISFMNTLLDGTALKMCADEGNNVYLVGSEGKISYFDGNAWQKESSGTVMNLYDVYARNGIVVAAGANAGLGKGIVLERKNGQWSTMVEGDLIDLDQLFKPKLYASTQSVWVDEKGTIYAAGNYLYRYRFGQWNYVTTLPGNKQGRTGDASASYLWRVRGNKSNDYWIVGEGNTLLHFNGATWKQIGFPHDDASPIVWRSIDVTDKLCIAVGIYGARPIAMIIKRN